ncbi:unnamed protein product [Rotaria magnacalcarata]
MDLDDDFIGKTVILGNKTYELDKLSREERFRVQHEAIHEKHKGHEAMHMEMILVLLVSLVISQLLLLVWQKYHIRSYQYFTLLGMWLIPLGLSIRFFYIRFIIIWIFFTIITGYVTRRATRQPIEPNTPRLVYKWFLLVYKVSYGLAIGGYCLLMMTFLGINVLLLISPQACLDIGILTMFYGIYYGVLGRDMAESCTDRMASKIGYYSETGLPKRSLESNTCAVCANPILVQNNEQALIEETYKLQCGHTFHEFCIRGWCIVGKKQTCPYCKEKVDLKRLFPNPWEKPHVLYGNLLDWIRYLVAWQPLILLIVQGVNYVLGLE